MVRGLYTAWTGLRNEEKRMDVVTNNMANADTTGFKKVDVTAQSFDRQLAVKIDDPTIGPNLKQGIGGVNLGVKIGETYFDMSQGNFRQTEDQYNLALSGSGFFTISTTDKSQSSIADIIIQKSSKQSKSSCMSWFTADTTSCIIQNTWSLQKSSLQESENPANTKSIFQTAVQKRTKAQSNWRSKRRDARG